LPRKVANVFWQKNVAYVNEPLVIFDGSTELLMPPSFVATAGFSQNQPFKITIIGAKVGEIEARLGKGM
jgi:hypothetical protein